MLYGKEKCKLNKSEVDLTCGIYSTPEPPSIPFCTAESSRAKPHLNDSQ